jgi:hypothetical protein
VKVKRLNGGFDQSPVVAARGAVAGKSLVDEVLASVLWLVAIIFELHAREYIPLPSALGSTTILTVTFEIFFPEPPTPEIYGRAAA